MIVQESDILLAALDRRLQIDRVQRLDPAAALARSPDDAGQRPSANATQTSPAPVPTATADARTVLATNLAARLPLGEVIVARVVDVPSPDHVIAEIDTLRVAMAWPKGSAVVPRAGQDVRLRVLAHRPMLLFQNVRGEDGPAPDASRDADGQTHWSSDALRMQRSGGAARAAVPTRFDVPILDLQIESLPDDTSRAASSLPQDDPAPIGLDDVIVARGTTIVDGIAAPLIARATGDAAAIDTAFVPLVLQGPAWNGQPMELVVRRERADEAFDNPVLDQWCGEVLIDLPHLGRVAAHLSFSMQGLRIRLEGDDETGVAAMTAGAAELARVFAGADLRVSSLSVGGLAADSTRRPRTASMPFTDQRDG